MLASQSKGQMGKLFIVLAAIVAVMGIAFLNASPANADYNGAGSGKASTSTTTTTITTTGTCPSDVIHPAVYGTDYKYDKAKWEWKDGVDYSDKTTANVGDSSYGNWKSDGDTGWGSQQTVDTVVKSGSHWYMYSNETTKPSKDIVTAASVEHTVCETPSQTVVYVCANLEGGPYTTPPEGYTIDPDSGNCLTAVTLGVSSTDPPTTPTPKLTEVVLAATGAGGTTGGVALALSMVLGGLGLMLLRRQGKSKI